MARHVPGFTRFEPFAAEVNGVTVTGCISRDGGGGRDDDGGSGDGGRNDDGGSGDAGGRPPLLLLRGHPETHLMWHRIADALAEDFTVTAPALRGDGASSKPAGEADHSTYSKREMANNAVLLMAHFGAERGFSSFALCAHDRGARVGHRMLADYPGLCGEHHRQPLRRAGAVSRRGIDCLRFRPVLPRSCPRHV